ncbi:MAG: SDR family oxidoreductase [Anaerolineae bacterium]
MILVVGATGTLGGIITRMLLVAGKPVRILARPRSRHQPLALAGADIMMGDLKNPESLYMACSGVDTVITTANSVLRGGEDTIESVDLRGNQNLIDAARDAGVRHFILMSVLGSTLDSSDPFTRAKAETEAYLRASGMLHTIIAPNIFMEVWPAQVVGAPALKGLPVKIIGNGWRRHAFISIGDVAAFTIAAVDHPGAKNKTLPLGGPEALTWRDVIHIYEWAMERAITAEFLPPGSPIPHLSEWMTGMLAAMDTFDTMLDTTELADAYGVRLTPLHEVIQRTLEPAHA